MVDHRAESREEEDTSRRKLAWKPGQDRIPSESSRLALTEIHTCQ
jgi:hypothetical protein